MLMSWLTFLILIFIPAFGFASLINILKLIVARLNLELEFLFNIFDILVMMGLAGGIMFRAVLIAYSYMIDFSLGKYSAIIENI